MGIYVVDIDSLQISDIVFKNLNLYLYATPSVKAFIIEPAKLICVVVYKTLPDGKPNYLHVKKQ